MKPSIGRQVHVINHGHASGGIAPALVTRVHGDSDPASGSPACVNVTIFPDGCPSPHCSSSVQMFETREDAERHLATLTASPPVAFWPDREPQAQAKAAPLQAAA